MTIIGANAEIYQAKDERIEQSTLIYRRKIVFGDPLSMLLIEVIKGELVDIYFFNAFGKVQQVQ